MQRRAVAVYVAFFLVIATASYTLLATAEEPTITLDDNNVDYELSEGDTLDVGDREYTVASLDDEEGSLEWTETDVEMTETWANEDTVEVDGTEWEVVIGENATAVTLEEPIDREAILEDDPDADNETVERDDGEYVIVNGETVPVDEYFPEPTTRSYSEGETLTYDNRTVTVDEVADGEATLVWTEDETNTEELSHEGTVELADDTEYLVFFPGDGTVQLTEDTSEYDAQVEDQEQFSERLTGLRYVIFTSMLFVVSLIALAFLPSRY
ncbi:MAG: hypothetical protein ACOC0Z_06905 [Halohasta sp.]